MPIALRVCASCKRSFVNEDVPCKRGKTPQERYIASSRDSIEQLLRILQEINRTVEKPGNRQKILTKADEDLREWTANSLKSTCASSPQTLFPTSESIRTASDSLHDLIKLYSELSSKRNLYSIEQDMLNYSLPRTFHEMIELCNHLLKFMNENVNIINRAKSQNIVLLHKEIEETNRNLDEYRKVTQVNIIWHPNVSKFREMINEWITEIARVITQK